MYRLMLYYLIFLVVFALVVDPDRINILAQTLVLLVLCYVFNRLFAKLARVPPNLESFAITALILSLIVGPTTSLITLSLVSLVAMASKYFLVINKHHLFNPAAVAVILANAGASWWVGNPAMIIPTIVGGVLILKKTRRFTLAISFLLVYFLFNSQSLSALLSSPLLFFTFVMLIEPLTSPSTRSVQIIYSIIVSLVFLIIPIVLPSTTFPLELSLILGNLFSFFSSAHFHTSLTLQSQTRLTPNIISFNFLPDKKFSFAAGQFIELTLAHPHPDSRGIRRFFTISSSPTEKTITITSKFATPGSSFKLALQSLKIGDKLISTNPQGEFTLINKPLVFIAGGIGITPFRSMIKYLSDTNQKRDILLLYLAGSPEEFVFQDVFKNTHTVYKVGRLEAFDITNLPNFPNCTYYISGPPPMVDAAKKILHSVGINKIQTDYFPGY